MPEGERSELTSTVLLIADAMMEDIKTVAEELAAVPLMQEEISQSEYQRRFRAMTPQQRLAEMNRIGIPEVLRLMAPSQNTTPGTFPGNNTPLGGTYA